LESQMTTRQGDICFSLENILLLNHWPEFIDIWHGASFGHGDSNVFK